MSDLSQALIDIRGIRQQLAVSTEFRGYGPLTLGATAGLALITGLVQARWIVEPAAHPAHYVGLWLTTGVISAALIVSQMLARAERLHSGLADQMVRLAVTQFLPAALAGTAMPLILLRTAPGVIWVLPGLWQTIFGLGVFASCRSLPRLMLLAGSWFLLTGFTCLALGDARALAPTAMAGSYAIGMALVAGIHSLSAKRGKHDEDEEL